jgi:hypothetical protein
MGNIASDVNDPTNPTTPADVKRVSHTVGSVEGGSIFNRR